MATSVETAELVRRAEEIAQRQAARRARERNFVDPDEDVQEPVQTQLVA